MKPSSASGLEQLADEGSGESGNEKRCLNSELWHACAGPLVCLPNVGTRVVYLPQGHSEQVAASTNKEVLSHIPNYQNLPPQLICQLHDVTMHADVDTDEVYAQMTLQPLSLQEQEEVYLPMDMGMPSKQPTNYFCKTLTASDTSTHGGFSVPRRAAEKVFPPLDFSKQPPVQELTARDLHDVEWKFRHIFRGQPKRHLLTTGWSVFVSAKRLVAGDSVLFIWNEKNQLLLGIRRANRPQSVMPSSVLPSDSMHIGLLAAAAHATATNSRFTIFYNPRACPSEFVIPLSKYVKAVYHTRVSVGMRFRMLFETEESSVRRYMGTVTGTGDLDPVRWPNSCWRSVKVGWDESIAGEKQPRVSTWEIEPLTAFPMYPSLFPLRLKRPLHPGMPIFLDSKEYENNALMWLSEDAGNGGLQSNFHSLGMGSWVQQRLDPLLLGNEYDQYQAMAASALQDIRSLVPFRQQYLNFQPSLHFPQQPCNSSPFLQQVVQQRQSQQIIGSEESQAHSIPDSEARSQHLQQQSNDPQRQQLPYAETNPDSFVIENNNMVQLESTLPSSLTQKLVPPVANAIYASAVTPFGSSYLHGGPSSLNFSRVDSSISSEQNQQPWGHKIRTPQIALFGNTSLVSPLLTKDVPFECDNTTDSQNHNLFGACVGSSAFESQVVATQTKTAVEFDAINVPYTGNGLQNSLYGCLDDSSGLLQNIGEVDLPKTFVKVYKSGSVGRSLDITRFSDYGELRRELGRMFDIEGELEDPLRSGWQLVFVDMENDVLLLGDDPWEAFVSNVWYIKILSPEDVLKTGKHEGESLC